MSTSTPGESTRPRPQGLSPAAVAAGVRELVAHLDGSVLDEALHAYAVIDGVVDAARCRRLGLAMTAAEESGQDPLKVARSAASRGGKSARYAAELTAKRARATSANEALSDRLDSGELSIGQIDNIAKAMDTDPSAATDHGLIDQIAERSVDQGRRVANDWATEKASAKDLEAKHQRQRKDRTVQTYWSADREAMALTLYGDGPTIDQLWRRINAQERVEYQNDGGRDVSVLNHPRTRHQRRFDSAVALLMGSAAAGRSGGRPAAVFSIPWSKISGENPDACVEQIGYGPIADSAVVEALTTSELFVNITGLHGQTMWWGRTRRTADRNQFISLVVRDKGCVLCGNDWQSSESHHLMPYEAPGKGTTDIDRLALVCSGCHHKLHDNHLTLYRDPTTGQWLTRPATPDEIAPNRKSVPGRNSAPKGNSASTRTRPAGGGSKRERRRERRPTGAPAP